MKNIFQDVLDNMLTLLPEVQEKSVTIEISLLKNFKKVIGETEEEILSQIIPHVHGVFIEKNNKIATLLPSGWQKIEDKNEFLNQICYKLKLQKDAWKKMQI